MRSASPLIRLVALLAIVLLPIGTASAQEVPAPAASPPPQVQELLRLLQDPVVRGFLEQARPPAASPPATPAWPPAAPPQAAPGGTGDVSTAFARRLETLRTHIREMVSAVPRLPRETSAATRLIRQDLSGTSTGRLLLLLAALIALGLGSELVFRRATARLRAGLDSLPAETAAQRVRGIALRLAFGLAGVAIFAAGSLAAFLMFSWPPLVRQLVLGTLLALVFLRLVLVLLDVALVPSPSTPDTAERFRLLPITTVRARFWQRRIALFLGYFAFGWMTVQLMDMLGFPVPSRQLVAYVIGLGLLVIALEALWRSPQAGAPVEQRKGAKAIGTAYAVALWLVWVAGLLGLFWVGIFAVLLPRALAILRGAVSHVMRSGEGDAAASLDNGITRVLIERGLRAVVIVAAVLWLARVWHIDLVALTTSADAGALRLARGVLTSVVVLLVADLLWHLVKAMIDAKLADTDMAAPNTPEAVRQARLRTLLPIFRIALLVLIAVMAALTALSALGVEIAPLIAGAGVLGVAIGFGSQTLVRDVIGGIFYLLDDAFRVGEYIQSGSFKGTVEGFSLRSVRLRHHNGPLFTVPFGQLGAVQNMSRDWVIDKFSFRVTYDTDLEKARKIVKKVGQELAADPELGPKIIEAPKLQGVEAFGDYGIDLRVKLMAYPGEQYAVRRKAYVRIKDAFDKAGIRFASPTVQVAGGAEEAAAAAQVVTAKAAAEAPPAAA